MELIQGKGVSKGIVSGIISFYRKKVPFITKKVVPDIQNEKRRLQAAQRKTLEQMNELAEHALRNSNEQLSLLMKSSAMFVEDESFIEVIHGIIEEQHCNAEYAVQSAVNQSAVVFSTMEDLFLRARETDFRDTAARLIGNLLGIENTEWTLNQPVILASDDLPSSELVRLEKKMLGGILLKKGTEASHTVIFARSMGIPTIIGLGDDLREEFEGTVVFMDGTSGQVILQPDESLVQSREEQMKIEKQNRNCLEEMKGVPDQTLDGREFRIYCNVNSVDDLESVLKNDGRGIGLFRSESIFLESDAVPSEETQFLIYRKLAEVMQGKDVYIRTLDLGADKQVRYLTVPEEENPALGLRGIRLCLERPELFRTQLRAIYRASAYGKISILFPMITSLWEVRECKRMCRQVMEELEQEGLSFGKNTKIGMIIETPSAVLMADELAKEVDFFSIGTNDLTQYLLASDRQSETLEKYFDPYHPAVLRALKMVACAAQKEGIPVEICGASGADPSLLHTFLAMGIDGVSVQPEEVLSIREKLRKTVMESLKCEI